MEQMLNTFIAGASTIQKSVFLLVCGVVFVFVVQAVFYLIVKLWPKKTNKQ